MSTKSQITDALRKAINDSGITSKALERETGVTRPSIVRFRRGDQSLRLDAADKIAAFFGLELVAAKRKRGATND